MRLLTFLSSFAVIAVGTPALANPSFTIVTENTVDVANLFTHPDLKKIDPSRSGVPAKISHSYTLRATYTLVGTEAEARTELVPAGCSGQDGAVSCWPDHRESRLNLNNSGNKVKWELVDGRTGSVLDAREAPMNLDEILDSEPSRENVNFAGPQGLGTVSPRPAPDQGFALSPGYSVFFSEMFLDALYRGARLTIEPRGNNRFALVGLEYGGQTETGQVIPVVPGASFLNAGVWLTKASDPNHPFLAGEGGSNSPWTKIQVKSVSN